jgi:NHLM bacteriocin system ABC transporter ATP-binding protein
MAATARIRAFSRFFTDAASPVDLHDDRLIRLSRLDRALLVEFGSADVFAVRLEDDKPVGRWTFLTRAEQGTVLLGSPRGPRHTLVCRPVPGSYVSSLPLSRLSALSPRNAVDGNAAGRVAATLSGPEYAVAVQQFVRGLEKGLVDLAGAHREGLPPRSFTPLNRTGPTELEAGSNARSIDGLRWVVVDEGGVQLPEGGWGTITAGTRLCLTEQDWLVAETPSRLSTASTMELLAEGELWRALITHSARFLYAVDRRIERGEAAEKREMEVRAEAGAASLAGTARGFDTLIRDTSARVRLADVADDPPALAAVRLVAARLGATVRRPIGEPSQSREGTDAVHRVVAASGMRTRPIRLEGRWWRTDQGPLIARRAGTGTPLALLPDRGGYIVALPDEGRLVPVDAKVAATLRTQAEAVYPPLPDHVAGIRGLLRFGFRGAGRDLRTLALVGVLLAALGLLTPIVSGQVLGSFVARAQRGLIVQGAILLMIAALVAAVLSAVQNIAALRLEGRAAGRMQAGVWMRVMSLPVSFFGRYSTGELGTTALGVTAVQEQLSSVTTTATLGVLVASANLALVFWYSVPLALAALGLVAGGAGVCLAAGLVEIRWQRRLYAVEQRLASKVFQLLTAVPKLRVAAAEDRAFAIWAADFRQSRAMAASGRRVQNFITAFNAGYPIMCSAVVFALVAGPGHGTMPITAFVAFYTAFTLMLGATLQFTGVAITVMGVVPMLERMRPLLEEVPEADLDKAEPGELSGRILLSHVSFRYGADGPLVLDDVTLAVEPGEFVAIVGPTGCGKSTVLRLLLGFEEPKVGAVLFDGQDLAELDISAVRRQCGVVLQNGSLLAGSIFSNIVGTAPYTEDQAWAAARMAGIDEEIAAMPMGMNTLLSEGTSTLSGGQRQRLMIARTLVSRPRIVIFDEATSALDNPTQKIVAESTGNLNATRIVIAHRLSTITDADRIIVMEQGRIVQEGRYEQLMADTDGLFARLASRQIA